MARIKQRVIINGEQRWVTANDMPSFTERIVDIVTENLHKSGHKKQDVPAFRTVFAEYQTGFWGKLRPNTVDTYLRSANNHILPRFGDVPIGDITTAEIQRMYDELDASGCSNETIKKVRNIMNPVFEYAIEKGIIVRNPFSSKLLTINGKETRPHKALKIEEMNHIRSCLPNLPDDQRRLLALLCYTGERIGEVLGFRWEDIDRETHVLHIRRGVTHVGRNMPSIGQPKTKNSMRTVPITDQFIRLLEPIEESGFILGGEQPLSYSVQRKLFAKAMAAVGISGYTAHDFRDTCATEWMEAGIGMKVIAEMLGHADVSTTANRYTKVRDQSLLQAARSMECYQEKLRAM